MFWYGIFYEAMSDVCLSSDIPICSIYTSQNALYHYQSLLDVDWNDKFHCLSCGNYPSVVVMDGTAISFLERALRCSTFAQNPEDFDNVQGTRFEHRLLIKSKPSRILLVRFGGGRDHRNRIFRTLTQDEYGKLLEHLSKLGKPLQLLVVHI